MRCVRRYIGGKQFYVIRWHPLATSAHYVKKCIGMAQGVVINIASGRVTQRARDC